MVPDVGNLLSVGHLAFITFHKGTTYAQLMPMGILVIGWVCLSIACCLALLAAAARPVPSSEQQKASDPECAARPQLAGGMEYVARPEPAREMELAQTRR